MSLDRSRHKWRNGLLRPDTLSCLHPTGSRARSATAYIVAQPRGPLTPAEASDDAQAGDAP